MVRWLRLCAFPAERAALAAPWLLPLPEKAFPAHPAVSSKAPKFSPELGPALPQMAAHQNIGVIAGFLVYDVVAVGVLRGYAAASEKLFGLVQVEAGYDHRVRRRFGIAPIP